MAKRVVPGTIVEVASSCKKIGKKFVYITEGGGGKEFSVGGRKIVAISPDAPLAKAILGLTPGRSALVQVLKKFVGTGGDTVRHEYRAKVISVATF